AGHRTLDHLRHRAPRLLSGAGLHPLHRTHLRRSELHNRPAVLGRESEDPPVRVIRKNPLAAVGVALVFVFAVAALLAPWIAPHDPSQIDLPARLQPASAGHWFGTDELGRDIFSRILYGARISMLVGVCVVAGSLFLGTIFGSLAGYYGGTLDRF